MSDVRCPSCGHVYTICRCSKLDLYSEIERLERELEHSLYKMKEIIGTPPWKVKALEVEIKRLQRVVDVAVRRIAANEPPWFFKTEARTRRLHEDVKRCLYAEALVELEDSND